MINSSSLAEKTLSPYFFVKSDEPQLDQFSLKSTDVHVNISGVIADVIITQIYENHGQKPLETIYIFPASTRSAVYGMKMIIGERTIISKIQEKEKARREYEEAKKVGKSASLLEQHRPNVFQMNVANILPGDVIKVEIKYTEILVPVNNIYEFVYPTVVGPRYSDQENNSETWVQNPYINEGKEPLSKFNIKVNLASALPVNEVNVSTHKTDTRFDGEKQAVITLDESEINPGNRDFILKYRHSGGSIESGILLHEGEEENFFVLMVEPPDKVTKNDIPKREYIFIVDVSGSMYGFPLDISKTLLRDLIGSLRSNDIFNVLLFSYSSSFMSEKSLPATRKNINKAISLIDSQGGSGNTELIPALKKAFAMGDTEDYSRTVVIVTDGYVNVEKDAFELIQNNLGKANVFSFGIGSSVNRFLIEGMARAGNGEPFIVTKESEAKGQSKRLRDIIDSPVLTNIDIDYGTFNVYDVSPVSIQDVFARQPVIVFGKWKDSRSGEVVLTGLAGKGKQYESKIIVDNAKTGINNEALRYLWARKRIELLDDYIGLSNEYGGLDRSDKRIKEVTELGLKYNLLTAYTSFVAIDSEVRLKKDGAVKVKQPLPLPEGVSGNAVLSQGKVLSQDEINESLNDDVYFCREESYESIYDELDDGIDADFYDGSDESVDRMTVPKSPKGRYFKVIKKNKAKKPSTPPSIKAKDILYSVFSNADKAQLNVKINKIKTTGKISKKYVEKLFRENLLILNELLAKVKKGEIYFYIEINGDGTVSESNVSVLSGEYNNADVQPLLDVIKMFKYSKPSDGKKAVVMVWLKVKG